MNINNNTTKIAIGTLIILVIGISSYRQQNNKVQEKKQNTAPVPYLCPIEHNIIDTLDIKGFNLNVSDCNFITNNNRLAIWLNVARTETKFKPDCDQEKIAAFASFHLAKQMLEMGVQKVANITKKGGNTGNVKCKCSFNKKLEQIHNHLRDKGQPVCTVSHYDPKDWYGKGSNDHYIISKGEWQDAHMNVALLKRAKIYSGYRKQVNNISGEQSDIFKLADELEGKYAKDANYAEKISAIAKRSNLFAIFLCMQRGIIIVHRYSGKTVVLNPNV